jgi:phage FluMu gp28-like protein
VSWKSLPDSPQSLWREVDRLKKQREKPKPVPIPEDFVVFFLEWLGQKKYKYQIEASKLMDENDSIAFRWSRQIGKTQMVNAWLLHYALRHPDSQIAVIGPSWRQTKISIRKINGFLPHLPRGSYRKPQATMVTLSNGSTIHAFPCNPDTIRGFTLHVVYADEFNYIPLDAELYDAIIFALSTTNGKFICSSTPGSTDSMFWKFFNRPQYNHFAKSHVNYLQAIEPNGPLKVRKVEQLKEEYADDQFRWQREMMAEWAEDEAVWLPLSLITKCQDANLELWNLEGPMHQGRFFGGLDFGKERDHSAFAVTERVGEKSMLRHLKVWPLGTKYASVIGYVKTLADRWETFERIRADITGVGNYIVEDMTNGGIQNVEGVNFTQPRKQEMASLLKQRMLNEAYRYPYTEIQISPTKKLNYSVELNVERFELKKDGTYRYYHPENQHDDVWWATALAIYATVEMKELDLEAFKLG